MGLNPESSVGFIPRTHACLQPQKSPPAEFSLSASPKFAGKERFDLKQGWEQRLKQPLPVSCAVTARHQLIPPPAETRTCSERG